MTVTVEFISQQFDRIIADLNDLHRDLRELNKRMARMNAELDEWIEETRAKNKEMETKL